MSGLRKFDKCDISREVIKEPYESFMQRFNPDDCLSIYEFNTVEQCYLCGAVKLSEISARYGSRQFAFSLIEVWIHNLESYFMIRKESRMPSEVISEVARYLYEEGYMMNLAELTLFFKKVKKGHYGEVYGRLDGAQLCRAMKDVRQERSRVVIKYS